MDKSIWRYFLDLEKDLARSIEFVEPNAANFGSYSNWFAKLLLLAGSEVDVVAKLLCAQLEGGQEAKNILDYQTIIKNAFPGIHEVAVTVPRYSLEFRPWLEWGGGDLVSPFWWKAYNDVKHERLLNFEKANLANVFNSLAGLMVLELYCYKAAGHAPGETPELLDAGFGPILVGRGSLQLPGLDEE